MRLGIFGGSFDPVHYGHLLLAETCRQQRSLDQIWFVPAAIPPHKQDQRLTPIQNRIEMLNLAIAGHEAFQVSTLEIDRGGVSYTVDTLKAINSEHPDAELFLLMGADSLLDLPAWRDPEEICRLAIPLTVRRAGSPPPDFKVIEGLVSAKRLELARNNQVEMPIIGLSSTALRKAVTAGQSIRYQTPRAVEKYIEQEQLYKSP